MPMHKLHRSDTSAAVRPPAWWSRACAPPTAGRSGTAAVVARAPDKDAARGLPQLPLPVPASSRRRNDWAARDLPASTVNGRAIAVDGA